MGWLWYLGMLVPVIGLVQIGNQAVADRFTYLPQIGLWIALAWGAADLCRSSPYRRRVCGGASALVLAVLMGCAWRQTTFWCDSETLWTHTLACTSRNSVAHFIFAAGLASWGRVDEALDHYCKALEIEPDDVFPRCNIADILAKRGRLDEAVAWYRKALKIQPNCVVAHNNLGELLARQGRFDEAREHYRKALQIQPDFAIAYYNLGNAWMAQDRLEEAEAQYRKALEIEPDYAMAHNNLGNTLTRRGRLDEALAHYQKALEIQANFAPAHTNVGNILTRRGQFDEALAQYRQALEIEPDFALARTNMGDLLAAQGRFPEALEQYQKAMKSQPKDPMVARKLAWLRATCPIAALRNGDEAVALARQANRLCGGKQPEILDTLAAAYAEAGWFPEALATAPKPWNWPCNNGIVLWSMPCGRRIALYEAGRPYCQTPMAPASAP